ncbi:MAG: PaaI family thioesterase [Neomegalonema sp.]|nr:PaaI family thioesterase [Neomegalonema sp.]
MSDRQPVLSLSELESFLFEVFPQIRGELTLESIGPMCAAMRLPVQEKHLRPGGTVSGPAMFLLADCTFYAATLAMIGREPLTVTTNLSINFLRKPAAAAPMRCEVRLLKLGRSLSVGEAYLYSSGVDQPVAHATATYAIPPK